MSWLATSIIASTAAASSYALALLGSNSRRRAGEPPLIRGRVPKLGVALQLGTDPPRFLAECRAEHGDVFTLFVAGRRMTFVLDPLSAVAVLKAPQLRFTAIQDDAMEFGFGVTDMRSRVDYDKLVEYDHVYLRGAHLSPVTARMESRLGPLLTEFADAAAHEWREVELYDWVWQLMFEAGTDALFGDGLGHDPQLAASFKQFDRAFPMLMGELPGFLTKQARAARADVHARLTGYGGEGSEWMVKRTQLANDEQLSASLNVALLWAATANTVPAVFWTLYYLINDPEALAAVRAELAGVIESFGSSEPLPAVSAETLDRLRMLDSAAREALRLSSATATVREVVETFTFEAPCGSWSLRKGDRVCLFPYFTHRDPEIHPEPERYRYDRFYSEVGIKRFSKGGQPVPIPVMPFGGGQSMCPGRFFAMNEVKLLVAQALHLFEFELVDAPAPGFDVTRAMLGIMPPAKAVPTRVRRAF